MTTARLTMLVAIALFLATMANGAVPYLKRVGVLDHPNYVWIRAGYCGNPGGGPDNRAADCFCLHEPSTASARFLADNPGIVEPQGGGDFYSSTGYEVLLKLGKDVLFAGFALLSLYLLRSGRAFPPKLAAAWPPVLLAANVGVGLLLSMVWWGNGLALTGLRPFEFLAVALLGGWAVGGMPMFARCLAWLIVVQVAILIPEWFYGMPLRGCPHAFRALGIFVLPSTLGVFAVVALAFHQSFSPERRWFWLLSAAVLTVLSASGSGTGLLTLFVLLNMKLFEKMAARQRWMAALAVVVLAPFLVVKLPAITNRPDLFDSVFAAGGRIDKLEHVVQNASAGELIWGRGIGFGTNLAANLADATPTPLGQTANAQPFYPDSTIAVLLTQLGVVGLILFYGMLAWGFWHDRIARSVYLAIGLTSLSLSIIEAFPMNFLLGLTLAHTLVVRDKARMEASS